MTKVLLHSCCAPCSAAILEWLLANDYRPTVLFYNPNIFPEEEYLKRKNEIVNYCAKLGVEIADLDGEEPDWAERHGRWLRESGAASMADLPERSARCLACFKQRLLVSARYAAEHGFETFTTTLASSRWKSFEQLCEAGKWAGEQMGGAVRFWDRNWRKGGLYERRNVLAKQFYNQTWCGCEFSLRNRDENL